MTLYPDVKCKILYQRDYLNLLVKYGLEEPSQGALLDTNGDGDAARDSEQTTAALFSSLKVG
jgi:hypothetical protein